MKIKFEKVIANADQVKKLYLLLSKKKNSISHTKLPSFAQHNEFVLNNLYIAWYLIYKDANLMGSVYLQPDNSIGINLLNLNKKDVIEIFNYIKKNHRPLPEIKSSRRKEFFINISPNDTNMIKILSQLKKKEIQRSFII